MTLAQKFYTAMNNLLQRLNPHNYKKRLLCRVDWEFYSVSYSGVEKRQELEIYLYENKFGSRSYKMECDRPEYLREGAKKLTSELSDLRKFLMMWRSGVRHEKIPSHSDVDQHDMQLKLQGKDCGLIVLTWRDFNDL